jgi:hypothetical protein
MADPQLRIPMLELTAEQLGGSFRRSRRKLTKREKDIARKVFRNSVHLSSVRVVVTGIASAPTTLGNNIRVLPGYKMSNATLIHELMHVWQYQTQGNKYISNSAYHQVKGMVTKGGRNAAYEVTIVSGQSIYRYTAEHQAMIVENYYSNSKNKHNKDYQRMIREVRNAQPSLTRIERYTESLYGPVNWEQERFMDGLQPNRLRVDQIAPIFRIEF